VIAGVSGAAALLLVVAGATKLVDPSRTVGALAALGWPSAPWLVRLGAVTELALGSAALVVGSRGLTMLVAASYLAFALFVTAARRSKTPIGTCGCFGQAETPPRPVHVLVDALLAVGAVAAAAADAPALVDASWVAWLVAGVVGTGSYSVFVARSA
jgi:hypothetical protein